MTASKRQSTPDVASPAKSAEALFAQANVLRSKAIALRGEADALSRAANRLDAFAAAIADGREDEIREIALDMAGR